MNYKEAIEAGYENADIKLQRGYVSRKTKIDDQEVLSAKGNRKGQLYVLLPSWESTEYCIRQYLRKCD